MRDKIYSRLMWTVVVFMVLSCMKVAASADTPESLKLSIQNYPRVDGSISTQPLGVLAACQLTDIPYEWVVEGDRRWLQPVIRKSSRSLENELLAGRRPSGTDELKLLNRTRHNGTNQSYMALIEGHADLILVVRQPSDEELAIAEAKAVELEVTPIARDAFVILVNIRNVVENMGLDKLRDIYTGTIHNWKQLGGEEQNIHAYQRNRHSGCQEIMEQLVMKGNEMIQQREMMTYSMMGPVDAIKLDTAGIGYTFYYYHTQMTVSTNVKMCSIAGIYPNRRSVFSGDYPLITEIYVVTRQDIPHSSNAYRVLQWLLSEKGKHAIEESGYITAP